MKEFTNQQVFKEFENIGQQQNPQNFDENF